MPLTPSQQQYIDRITGRAPVTQWVNTSGQPVQGRTNAEIGAGETRRLEDTNRSMAGHHNLVRFGQVASAIPLAFAGGAAALGGGAAGATAPGVVSPVATASRFSLSNMLDLGKLAAGLYGTISGTRANNNAQAQALAEQARQFEITQRMLAENEATRKAEMMRQTDEQARQWEAAQQFQGQQFRAQEEQRLHDRRLADEAEARRAPRREISRQALMRLSDFLGLARG